jgi:hypothetical protein
VTMWWAEGSLDLGDRAEVGVSGLTLLCCVQCTGVGDGEHAATDKVLTGGLFFVSSVEGTGVRRPVGNWFGDRLEGQPQV